jgi:hypothetical protein
MVQNSVSASYVHPVPPLWCLRRVHWSWTAGRESLRPGLNCPGPRSQAGPGSSEEVAIMTVQSANQTDRAREVKVLITAASTHGATGESPRPVTASWPRSG